MRRSSIPLFLLLTFLPWVETRAESPAATLTPPSSPPTSGVERRASSPPPSTSPPILPNPDGTLPPPDSLEWFIHATKRPFSWYDWGADLRLRNEYCNNATTLNSHATDPEANYQRYRTRVWSNLHPVPTLEFNSRLTWEWRDYQIPAWRRDITMDEALFDTLNLKWSQILDQPLTLTVGRQDIMLGNGWLIMDGTPLDGSRTFCFDAVRLTWEWKDLQTQVDAIGIAQQAAEDHWIAPFNNQHRDFTEQNERGAILYVSNKSLPATQVDGFMIYKGDRKVLANGDNADIYAPGARVAGVPGRNWKYESEFAPEFGRKNGRTLRAFGSTSSATWMLKDPLNNSFRVGYEYLSGDDPGSSTNEAFDPLWGRWPLWSDLLSTAYTKETRFQEITNLHRPSVGWSITPWKPVNFSVNYALLFADENTRGGQTGFSKEGRQRGQFLSTLLRYRFTEHLSSLVQAELFFPGDYYSPAMSDSALFLRYELVLRW